MKNLGKLKLNVLGKAEMEKMEMINLRGGGCCACSCSGSSSSVDNQAANNKSDYGQSGGNDNCACACCGYDDVNSIANSAQKSH